MFLNFEPNLIEKFLWKSIFFFFKFWSHDFFSQNENLFFGCHFETKHILIILFFADIRLFWVYTYGVSFAAKFYGKVLKNEWVHLDLPPCAKTGVKSSLGI